MREKTNGLIAIAIFAKDTFAIFSISVSELLEFKFILQRK